MTIKSWGEHIDNTLQFKCKYDNESDELITITRKEYQQLLDYKWKYIDLCDDDGQ